MISTETIPLLIVALLLLSASGVNVEQADIVFDGDHAITEIDDALIIGDGTVTVPADATVNGPVYVVGGELVVEGRIRGDVTLLSGNVVVGDGAFITGQLDALVNRPTIGENANIGSVRTVEVTSRNRSPVVRYGVLGAQLLVLAGVSVWMSRRYPREIVNVADSITHHILVSGVVGFLAGLTLLVLFVYMAFTLILLPVSIAGLVAELLVVAFSYVVYGHVIGRHLPIDRSDAATAFGAGIFLLAVELLGQIPYVGVIVQFVLIAVGFGAVLLTYFGLREFEPVRIPSEPGE